MIRLQTLIDGAHGTVILALSLLLGGTLIDEPIPAVPEPPAPVVGSAESFWLDAFHHGVFFSMQAQVSRVDSLFVSDRDECLAVSNSIFKLSLFLDTEFNGKPRVDFDPRFDADIHMPNADRWLRLFLSSGSPDLLTGDSYRERQEYVFGGIRTVLAPLDILDLDASAGVELNWPPVYYGKMDVARVFNVGSWRFHPKQRFYWMSDDGFGEITTLTAYWWLSEQLVSRSISTVRFSDVSRGVEWKQSIAAGRILIGDVYDMRHVIGAQMEVRGNYEKEEFWAEEYRLSLLYRWPMYREWMFWEVVPEVVWREEDKFEPVFRLRCGIDILFWGKNDDATRMDLASLGRRMTRI